MTEKAGASYRHTFTHMPRKTRKKTPRPVVEGKAPVRVKQEGATHGLRRGGGGDVRDTETKETEG